MMPLTRLVIDLMLRLDATPVSSDPPIAAFPGGRIVVGPQEIAVVVDGVGALFVDASGRQLIVEAAAINDGNEPRAIVCARHDELERLARRLFGDDIQQHDPLGLRGGTRAVMS